MIVQAENVPTRVTWRHLKQEDQGAEDCDEHVILKHTSKHEYTRGGHERREEREVRESCGGKQRSGRRKSKGDKKWEMRE